jgi:hypothetical protein
MCNLQSQPPHEQNQTLAFKEDNRKKNEESLKTWNEALTCKKNGAKAWQIKHFNIDQTSTWNMNQRNNSLFPLLGRSIPFYYKWCAKKYEMQLIKNNVNFLFKCK